jgi:hypothetical protein
MPTLAASLAGIGRIYLDESPASFCRFAGQLIKETRPGRVIDAFSQAVVVEHPIDLQVFHCNSPELVNNLAAVLVREVGSAPANPLMHPGYHLALFTPLGRSLFSLRKLALSFCQGFFFLSKETRVFNLLTVRERSKSLEAHINTNLLSVRRQDLRLDPFTTKADIPFAGAGTGQGDRLRLAFKGPVQFNFDMSNLANNQGIIKQFTAGRGLGKGQAIITAKAFETGIADFFLPGLYSAEESLHSQVKSDRYILQDLGMNVIERGTGKFESGKFTNLVIQTRSFPGLLKGGFALIKPMVIGPTTIFKLQFK